MAKWKTPSNFSRTKRYSVLAANFQSSSALVWADCMRSDFISSKNRCKRSVCVQIANAKIVFVARRKRKRKGYQADLNRDFICHPLLYMYCSSQFNVFGLWCLCLLFFRSYTSTPTNRTWSIVCIQCNWIFLFIFHLIFLQNNVAAAAVKSMLAFDEQTKERKNSNNNSFGLCHYTHTTHTTQYFVSTAIVRFSLESIFHCSLDGDNDFIENHLRFRFFFFLISVIWSVPFRRNKMMQRNFAVIIRTNGYDHCTPSWIDKNDRFEGLLFFLFSCRSFIRLCCLALVPASQRIDAFSNDALFIRCTIFYFFFSLNIFWLHWSCTIPTSDDSTIKSK